MGCHGAQLWWVGAGCSCSPLNVGSSSVVCPVCTFLQTTFCSVTAVIFSRSPVDKQHSLPEISYTDPAGRGEMLSLTVTVLRLGCGVQVSHMVPDSPAGSHVAVEWFQQLCYPLPPLRAWG